MFASHSRYALGFMDWLGKFTHLHDGVGLSPKQVSDESQSKADFVVCVLPLIHTSCKLITKEFANKKGKIVSGSFLPGNLIPLLTSALQGMSN